MSITFEKISLSLSLHKIIFTENISSCAYGNDPVIESETKDCININFFLFYLNLAKEN